MTPNENGIAAFEEDEYGTVAVQGEGAYGQKTFCFAYALAHLVDGSQGTRDELMEEIVEYFDLFDPVADFMADTTFVLEGGSIDFTDLSSNNPTGWAWEFEGGTPGTSTEQNPVVFYNTPGNYSVTLIVSNNYGSDTLTIPDFIIVEEIVGVVILNLPEINIYPSPVKDKLFISCKNNIISVEIFNTSFQVVNKQKCNIKQMEINIADLPPGIYYVRLHIGETVLTKKIIKI
nr:PKD domain-containing protein [Bacteroidota bacterium]